jgi:tRNA1Val (adenine37-N6)-methyltransferase
MSVFRFRHFEVRQESSAMKVGTDSMVLGALVQSEHPKAILDIGTGTGVLALMMAQKFSEANIVAVEIEPSSAAEAKLNMESSPWSDRIEVFETDIKDLNTDQKFDLIISNPPFYTGGLLNSDAQRAQARHVFALPFDVLFSKVGHMLNEDGAFWMIAPSSDAQLVQNEANRVNLFPTKRIVIRGKVGGAAIRTVLCFSFLRQGIIENNQLTIRNEDGTYTADYITLTASYHGVAI